MRLENHTGFEARILTTELPKEPFVRAVVIVKATYDLGPYGALTPSAEPLPITPEPLTTAYGMFHGELFPRKDGADLCVLGTMRRNRPLAEAQVRARIGEHASTLRVTGDRVWQRNRQGALIPSAPIPFTEMSLGYQRAFGGKAPSENGPVPWTDNPDGRGYYLTEESAEGQSLPNVEPVDGPFIARWDDRPPVAGWGPYPMFWGLRALEGVVLDEKKQRITKLRPRLFNHAHPALVVPAIRAGEIVEIEGMLESPVRFPVPREVARIQVTTGAAKTVVNAVIDGVFAWVDQGKVVVTQRAVFKYVLRKGERRGAAVSMVAEPAGAVSEVG